MDPTSSERPEAPEGAVLRTLVFTDLVDSTKLLERLGDRRAADLFERHDRISRDLLAKHGGREIDKSDGFLLLFERPLEAVRFSLDYHRALADTSEEVGEDLVSRVGVHLGEVFLRVSTPQDVARGAKPLEVDGLAKPLGFRVMSVAQGKQTLLTQGAFDMARRASVGERLAAGELDWIAHGPYLLKGVDEPLELFEVGVVGEAPLSAPPDSEKVRRLPTAGEELPVSERLRAAVRGRYVVEHELDHGGKGFVFRGRDLKHGRTVALKALLPEVAQAVGVKRLLQELTVAARLNHPHILPLYDSGEVDGLVYYVMPHVNGESLKDRLAREKKLPLHQVTRIAGEVASALDRTHREGVIHGDVTPANILLEGNHAVVTDFGIARAVDASEQLDVRGGGVFYGTPAYVSPEQAAGSTDLDGRSDLYSLGCTVYEMLAGHPPFKTGSARQMLTQHLVSPVPSLMRDRPDVPEHVERAVLKALEKDPADRFATLIEFANALTSSAPEIRWQREAAADGGIGLWGKIRSVFVRMPDAPEIEAGESTAHVASQFAAVCDRCGVANARRSRFCRECGARLEELGDEMDRGKAVPAAETQAELRQLTVMFSDVVGTASLSQEVDPERELEVIRSYQAVCDEAVRRFDGQIVQYQDHGVVAYFGHPLAHEDDPIRAGLASLQLVHSMQAVNSRLEREFGVRLVVRIGIHTGPTVMGPVGTEDRPERLAIGKTPVLAARLRDQAPPDGVLVSDPTYRLFKGYFTCQGLGAGSLDGVTRPVEVYRLLAESGIGRHLHATGASALPPLVGRESELATLLGLWGRATEGMAQVALLSGEAGIGKSRLVAAVRERVEEQPHILLQGGCSPYHRNTALHAVIDVLERWLGIHSDDPPVERVGTLEDAARQYLDGDPEAVTLLAGLLSVPLDDRYPPLALEPALQRKRTLEVLLALLASAAKQRPVLLVLEDLHWIDPSTLEFLTIWLDRGRASRMMVLLTFRPDFTPPWNAPHVSHTTLEGLDDDQVAQVVAGVIGGVRLPPEAVERIVQRTDGVPLFVEETTKALLESDHVVDTGDGYELSGTLPPAAIPLTLRDALTARMDRLGSAKPVVQLGAVIGRRFSADLLLEVCDLEDWVALSTELSRAVDSGILDSDGSGPQTTYTFRHALTQDNAYQSLVRKTREAHHRRIMKALEASFPETAEAAPELLAHHCTEANAVQEAIPYWRKAGQRGIARAAFAEAIHHLSRGVELIETLPEGSGRDSEELALQTALGMALQASKGYAAPDVDRAYARARVLCQKGGSAEELMPVLWGQYLFYAVRGEYGTAREVGEQMLTLAEGAGDREHLMVANLALGLNTLYQGRLRESLDHFQRGLALYDPGHPPLHEYQVLADPGAFTHSYLARTLWILGDVDRALECSHESLTLARTLNIPLSQAQALGMHTLLLLVRRDNALAHQYAAEGIEFAANHGFAYWLVLSSMCQGWLIAQDGRVEEGIGQFRRFLDLYEKQGAKLGLSWFLGVLAEMHAQSGETEHAFSLLAQASAHVEETGERYYEAEIIRLEGETELLRGGPDANRAAEECFLRALDVARGQSAASWELRASISLARTWRDQGRLSEARELLAGAQSKIASVSDPSPDHDDAQRLLDELEVHA